MERIENIVEKYYNEFQMYISVKHMEDYKLDIKPVTEMGFAMVETIKKNDIRYLLLNEEFANDLISSKKIERWKVGILYHEFTHIADDEILERSGVALSKKYVYRSYIEYHAEFIKTLYMLGIYPFPDYKTKILHINRIDSQYGNISIYDYLKKLKKGYIDDIDISKMGDMNIFISNYDRLFYYLGAASVYRIFCNYDLDTITDISGFENKLGKTAKQLGDILSESIAVGFDEKTALKSANVYSPLIQPFL